MNHQAGATHLESPSSSRNNASHAPTSGDEMQYNILDGTSTASSESQQTTESNLTHEPPKPSDSTNPTSWPSGLLDPTDQNRLESEKAEEENIAATEQQRIDSDLAQYGSSGIRTLTSSDTSSSSSSDDSRRSLPRPSTQQEVSSMGSHLDDLDQPVEGLWFRPGTDVEARAVRDRKRRASASNRAAEDFQSHLQPEAAPELPIQRDSIREHVGVVTWARRARRTSVVQQQQHRRPVLDIEEQEYRTDDDPKMRAKVLVLVVIFVFCILSLALYASLRMG